MGPSTWRQIWNAYVESLKIPGTGYSVILTECYSLAYAQTVSKSSASFANRDVRFNGTAIPWCTDLASILRLKLSGPECVTFGEPRMDSRTIERELLWQLIYYWKRCSWQLTRSPDMSFLRMETRPMMWYTTPVRQDYNRLRRSTIRKMSSINGSTYDPRRVSRVLVILLSGSNSRPWKSLCQPSAITPAGKFLDTGSWRK